MKEIAILVAIALLSGKLIIFLIQFVLSYIKWYQSPLWKLPGPSRRSTSWMFGKFFDIIYEPYMEPHKRWWREAEENARKEKDEKNAHIDMVHYSSAYGNHTILALNADIVQKVLFSNFSSDNPRFVKKLTGFDHILGDKGLVSLEGSDWQRHRRILQPSFQKTSLNETLDSVVPSLVTKFISYWQHHNKREIDIGVHLSNLTLEILGHVAFSHEFHALDSIEKWAMKGDPQRKKQLNEPCDDENYLAHTTDKVIQALKESLRASPKKFLMFIFRLNKYDPNYYRTKKALNDAVDEVVENAKLKVKQSFSNTGGATSGTLPKGPRSLLEALLDAKDTDPTSQKGRRYLDNIELRDEVKTFIVAGHETTSTWCYWCVYVLSKHSDIQEKVYNDIMKHAPSATSDETVNPFMINVSMVSQMKYFDAFMKEVLRCYPPVGHLMRITNQEVNFNGTSIPEKTRVVIPIHLLHRSPRYWTNPEEFRPERWLTDEYPTSHKNAYLPFSSGPRNCIGYYFAIMEAKLMMASLIRSFSFQIAPSQRDTKFQLTSFITMKIKPALKVCICSR